MAHLLAIDLGHRSGFALYGGDGKLMRYRSTNFGSVSRVKKAAWGVLRDAAPLAHVVAEGDRHLGEIWRRAAVKFDASFSLINAEAWRADLLLSRQRRSGSAAKDAAGDLAREVIAWSGLDRPTSLRHDAAEAILIGLWGVCQRGWLPDLPAALS